MKILERATKAKAKMWGSSIVGCGDYHYKYESGRENDWFMAGFSPRKKEFVLYLMAGVQREPALLKKLGKHKRARGACTSSSSPTSTRRCSRRSSCAASVTEERE